MSFKPQHKIRCYCNRLDCYHQQNLSKKNNQTTTKSTPTKIDTSHKFVKIKRSNRGSSTTCSKHGPSHIDANKHGLGHSDTNTSCYSRRNSNATLTSDSIISSKAQHDCINYNRRASLTSTTSSNMLSQDQEPVQYSIWSRHSPLDEHEDEFTEQRRCYERYKIPYEQKPRWEQTLEKPQEIFLVGNLKSTQPTQMDDSFIRELQKFRLENADDCFNVHRQNDLKMQNLLGANSEKKSASPVSLYSNNPDAPPLVPWSDAMKKLRSRLEDSGSLMKRTSKQTEEDARKLNRNYFSKLQGPLSKSYALRFQ